MEILHVSAECFPMAKVGGLADVVGALPKYQNHLGAIAKVVVPAYRTKFFGENEWEVHGEGSTSLFTTEIRYKILKEKTNKLGFDLYAVDIWNMLDTPQPYGYPNDVDRFMAFQRVVLSWVRDWQHQPDVIHCHDHHTGLIPFMMYYTRDFERLKNIPTVFTIHNGMYQGWIGWDQKGLLPAYDINKQGLLEWGDTINSMASAVKCAWKFTTVSQSYLEEMFHSANGLEGLISSERQKAFGILNGIDNKVWDPEEDDYLDHRLKEHKVKKWKRKNKEDLCEEFNLDPEKPLFSFIGRLVPEKGGDLLAESFHQSLLRHQRGLNALILGSGTDEIEKKLSGLNGQWKGNYNAYIGYNEKLAHRIYAGSDFLLMPSRVEPCGLNQMYALRYGTIPIVRNVGGLRDTVTDIGDADGFGIRFDQPEVWDVCHSIDRAVNLFEDKDRFNDLRKHVMTFDHSWDSSAQRYLDLYQSLR